MALADLDQADGVPVNVVSKKLHVDSSFVTTQSKLLEKKGFLRRKTFDERRQDRPDVADGQDQQAPRKHLATQQEALNDFIFAEFEDTGAGRTHRETRRPQKPVEKAWLKVAWTI